MARLQYTNSQQLIILKHATHRKLHGYGVSIIPSSLKSFRVIQSGLILTYQACTSSDVYENIANICHFSESNLVIVCIHMRP